MPDDATEPRRLKTVTTAAQVIDALADMDGAGVTTLANRFDISKSTAHTHLKTLEENGLVTKRGDEYGLSYKFLQLGEHVKQRNLLYQVGKPKVDKLADETGQYCHLVTEENGRGINLYKIKGQTAVGEDYQAAKLQQRDRLHLTASGKAILSELDRSRVEAIVDRHGLPARTARTITDREELFETLAEIREQGFAYNDEEEIEGLRAVGAPICDRHGDVLGSISVSGPTSFLQGERFRETIPEQVVSTANVIEVSINMSDRSGELIDHS